MYPTWLVARETEPVEDQKDEGLVENTSDTEAGKPAAVDQVTSLDTEDKNKFTTARTSTGVKD